MEVNGDEDAYYHHYYGKDTLYLAYPLNLFSDILTSTIDCVEDYLRTNHFNPYDFVTDTSRWQAPGL